MIAAFLLAALPPLAQDTETPSPEAMQPPQTLSVSVSVSELKDEIDRSLRWLRSRQDVETGSYGGLRETAQVLHALAESPRHYRATDGPFVAKALDYLLAHQREDGAFASPDDSDSKARRATRVVIRALRSLEAHERAEARAVAFLDETGPSEVWNPGVAHEDDPDPGATALRRAALLLSERDADGSWGGAVLTTADNVANLSRFHATAEAHAPRAAPVEEARPLPHLEPADAERVEEALARGAAFLVGAGEDGRWGFPGQPNPGITAMVAGALATLPEPRPADVQEALDGALDWLRSLQKEDGSIHDGQLANYVTSAAILALASAGRESDEERIARAREFLVALQADEGEGYESSERFYGGVGYGGDERPDLSNLQMALEALSAAGTEAGDPAFEKALAFLQRCQNRSESNDVEVVAGGDVIVSGNDGGAGYAPGDSKAGFLELSDGRRVPRSYGSMTYALLKGYLFAGLPKTDPRVEAAWDWLSKNYTLDVNPGFEASSDPTAAYQGLFYYFTTMARALDLYGEEIVVDARGTEHSWRAELSSRLVGLQRQDGSWVNDNAPRWFEGNPVLATAYAMVALRTAAP